MDHHYDENTTADEAKILCILNQQMLQAEENGDAENLATLLTEDFTIIRASGVRKDREVFLGAVEANVHRGRTAKKPEVGPYRDCAVVIIRVTASDKRDGALTTGRFWNTRMFIQQEEQGRCATWQVTETRDETGRQGNLRGTEVRNQGGDSGTTWLGQERNLVVCLLRKYRFLACMLTAAYS